MEKRVTITSNILKVKAEFFFKNILLYNGVELLRFSTGWLVGFKTRHYIKQYMQHSKAGDMDRTLYLKDIAKIQEILKAYKPDDIFNCDETGLM